MIKIIEEGKKEFITTCTKCGTKFSYELNDIEYGKVKCPLCKNDCYHEKQPPTTIDNIQFIPTSDPYEKIPYWQRPEYKPPQPMC